ncbi:MAG: hypothetical protein ABIT71_08535 [Vicinamibacteraceae bacterium]
MTFTLCPVNAGAIDKLPAKTDDKSGVGVHYVDAYIKPMNVKREDGIAVKCKRRGIKIVLTVKGNSGEGLLRRLANGPDPVAILDAALQEAAAAAGVTLAVGDGRIDLTIPE